MKELIGQGTSTRRKKMQPSTDLQEEPTFTLLQYCSPYHTVAAYRKAYAGFIKPTAPIKDWGEPAYKVGAPNFNIQPGRPKVARRRDDDEEMPTKSKAKKCGNCGFGGHNRRRCKGPVRGQADPDGRATARWAARCANGGKTVRGIGGVGNKRVSTATRTRTENIGTTSGSSQEQSFPTSAQYTQYMQTTKKATSSTTTSYTARSRETATVQPSQPTPTSTSFQPTPARTSAQNFRNMGSLNLPTNHPLNPSTAAPKETRRKWFPVQWYGPSTLP